jgi:glycosyltransferase involved in cell wall biosynthesis
MYGRAAGSLIIVDDDPIEYTACGFTALIEAMAMSRPVILTRTSALKTEIDVEKTGCGFHVPPNNPEALADAINSMAADRGAAEEMGRNGRRLAERHYNIERYARDLHAFFESL